jgi:hypothetical protein
MIKPQTGRGLAGVVGDTSQIFLLSNMATSSSSSGTVSLSLPIAPRYMWGWGPGMSGYCGEMSTQVWISLLTFSAS